MTLLFDTLFAPVFRLAPLASLLLISLATAAVLVLVVARVSDQAGVASSKRAIHAALLELRLFNDDLGAVLRALADILRQNGRYLRLSLVPMLWMAGPLVFVVAQLQAFYGYDGLTPGRPALVKAQWRPGAAGTGTTTLPTLEVPAGIRLDTEAVRLAQSTEVLWRIVPTQPGDFVITLRAGPSTASKSLHVSSHPARRSPARVSASLFDQVLYPSEPPLPSDGPFAAITVSYPETEVEVLGLHVHWLLAYLLLSTAGALLLARWFAIAI
jgi:hypothetical protein